MLFLINNNKSNTLFFNNFFIMIKKIFSAFIFITFSLDAMNASKALFATFDKDTRHKILLTISTHALKSPEFIVPFLNPVDNCKTILTHIINNQIYFGFNRLLEHFDPKDTDFNIFFSSERIKQIANTANHGQLTRKIKIKFFEAASHLIELHHFAERIASREPLPSPKNSEQDFSSYLAEKLHEDQLEDIGSIYEHLAYLGRSIEGCTQQ